MLSVCVCPALEDPGRRNARVCRWSPVYVPAGWVLHLVLYTLILSEALGQTQEAFPKPEVCGVHLHEMRQYCLREVI